jgi:hypothetical protein
LAAIARGLDGVCPKARRLDRPLLPELDGLYHPSVGNGRRV